MFRTHHSPLIPTTLALLTALTLLAGPALAAPPVNQANGGGTVDIAGALWTIAFTSQIDATGLVKGQVEFVNHATDVSMHGTVDCLSVSGTDAWIGGVIRTSSDPTLVGTQFLLFVRDNGEGAAALPDQTSGFQPGAAGLCTSRPLLPLFAWTNGNVQVR